MPSSLRMLLRLWRQYAKMDLLWFLRDTRYCLLWIFTDAVAAVSAVGAVLLLSARFGGVGGMTTPQVLFMSGYAVLTDGLFSAFFGGENMGYVSRIIGRGQLDHMLLQPVPLWVQVLSGGFLPVSGSGKLLCGAALTAYAVRGLGIAPRPAWLALFAASLAASTAVVLAADYLVSCCAFFAPVAAEEISGKVIDLFGQAKYYPLGGLPSAGAALFCTVLPVGLSAWFPANALLGRAPLGLPSVWTLVAAAALCAAAALAFRKGLRFYAKNGSVRYSGFGFR